MGTSASAAPFPDRQQVEIPMVDDKTKRAPQDAKLISLTEDYEVEYWTERFGGTRERLATAVRRVGNSALEVERYLRGM
jgi:hypothetical protein